MFMRSLAQIFHQEAVKLCLHELYFYCNFLIRELMKPLYVRITFHYLSFVLHILLFVTRLFILLFYAFYRLLSYISYIYSFHYLFICLFILYISLFIDVHYFFLYILLLVIIVRFIRLLILLFILSFIRFIILFQFQFYCLTFVRDTNFKKRKSRISSCWGYLIENFLLSYELASKPDISS